MENNISANDLNGLNRLQLLTNIVCTTLQKIRNSSRVGFYTIKGTLITSNNVPDYFREMYIALEKTKDINDNNVLYVTLRNMTVSIMCKNIFTNIISQVIDFYCEAFNSNQTQQQIQPATQEQIAAQTSNNTKKYIRDPNGNPMIENLRQTFYDIMMAAVQNESDIIPAQDIIDFEPYVALAMPALSIIYNIIDSLEINGIKLVSGHVITVENCPIYQDLFTNLIEVKQMIRNKNLIPSELVLLKYKCANNPEKQIPENLLQYDSSELKNIASKIINIAIDISRLYDFKKNLMQFMR